MAVTLVAASSIESTSITIPGSPQAGDLVIIFAFRSGSATPPTTPSPFTQITTTAGTLCASAIGRCLWFSGLTSGTWTNTTGLVCHVYRGTATNKTPVGTAKPGSSSGTTIGYPLTNMNLTEPGTSTVAAFSGIRNTNSTMSAVVANFTSQTALNGATASYAGIDTNGAYTAGQGIVPAANASVGGTSAAWVMDMIEIYAEQGYPNNFQNAKDSATGDTGILSFGEKVK